MIAHCRGSIATLLLILCCCVTTSAVWAENRCAGGGKPRPDEGGIGGTGDRPVAPDDDDSGIGGTGLTADGDIGIIGTITGFASICVGDVEIHYHAGSVVEIDGQPATVSALAVGQVVEIVASGSGSEMSARQIAVRHVVAGPVTGFDAQRGTLDVMGQSIQLPDTQRYEIGQWVRISGLRRADGAIVASLVTVGDGDTAHIVGPVAAVAAGWLSVGGTRISVADDAHVAVGDEVRVTGRWDGTQLMSTAIEPRPRLPFDGRLRRVEVEGFAGAVAGDQVRVGSFVFEVPSTKSLPPVAGEARVRIHALIQERRAIVQDMGVLAPRPARPEPKEPGPEAGRILNHLGPAGSNPRDDAPAGVAAPPVPRREGVPGRPVEGRPAGAVPDAARPERPEPAERPERPAPPERPPHIERPPLPERVERPERPPRPERPDIPRRP